MVGKRGSLRERFEAKVDKSNQDGCWIWKATKNRHGYGNISVSSLGGKRASHRVSFELYIGPIPDGLCVCHKCDNPSCVRPDHLFLGTKADNVADMDSKGRRRTVVNPNNKPPHKKGSEHSRAILTEGQVMLARELHLNGQTIESLARLCAVHKSTMANALKGKNWTHVSGATPKTGPRYGSNHCHAKLTEEIVQEARRRHAMGESGNSLAREFGINQMTMHAALHRIAWKHVA